MSVSFCLPHPVAVSAFMICRGLCACTEMLWMCVLYVSFGSKVRPRTFGCVAMCSALLFIVRSILLVYSAGSGVNRVQVVLSGFSRMLFCFVQAKTLCMYGCMNFVSCVHHVAVLSAAFGMTCSLLMLVDDAIGDHTEEAYSRAGLITALYVAMSVILLFTPSCCSE